MDLDKLNLRPAKELLWSKLLKEKGLDKEIIKYLKENPDDKGAIPYLMEKYNCSATTIGILIMEDECGLI